MPTVAMPTLPVPVYTGMKKASEGYRYRYRV